MSALPTSPQECLGRGGLAFAIGLGERRLPGRALLAGLAGAVLGTIAFDVVRALAFPLAKTDALFSLTWPTRLLVSLGTAAALALSLPPTGQGTRMNPPLAE